MYLLILAVLVFTGQVFVSCSTTPTRNRGSLSDAMDKSRDDSEEDRSVPDESREPEPSWPSEDERKSQPPQDDGRYADAGMDLEPLHVWIGLRGGSTEYESQDIGTYIDLDILAGAVMSKHTELDLYAGFRSGYPVPGSSLDESVKDVLLFFKAGVEGKYVPFSDLPVMSPFIFAGIGGYYMLWNFENPLEAGDETINGDTIGGAIFTIGAGIYPVNLKRIRMGISIIPELYVFGALTREGFTNDYFTYFDTVKIMGEVSFNIY